MGADTRRSQVYVLFALAMGALLAAFLLTLAARAADPLALAAGPAPSPREEVLLVYPRFYTLEEFSAPAGRRYQPGGIPLSSSTGDAIEFVGTREYREGDPVKNIHWRSWARRG